MDLGLEEEVWIFFFLFIFLFCFGSRGFIIFDAVVVILDVAAVGAVVFVVVAIVVVSAGVIGTEDVITSATVSLFVL